MDIVQMTLIGVILFGILIGFIILRKRILYKNSVTKGDVDYRSFYVIGITYIGAGVALSVTLRNPGFFGITGIGLVYMIIGLKNQDKW
jgi:O-antigen ligase